MKPAQVLEAQADLVSRLSRPDLARYFQGVFASQYDLDNPHRGSRNDGATEQMVRTLRDQARLADAYRVTEDMSDTVVFAASKLDSSDLVDRSLAPTPWGFVRFDKPLPVKDARGRLMLANWLIWGPATIEDHDGIFGGRKEYPGVFATWWNDTLTHPDEVATELAEKYPSGRIEAVFGRWGFVGAEWLRDRQPLGTAQTTLRPEQIDKLVSEGVAEPSDYTNATRYLHALWLLLGQTITEVADETRHLTKKQAARIGKAPIPGRVSVIRLRRVDYGRRHGESHVEWQRRWLVRGHWRWQPCGPGRTERVRIWISPYVKGPEDKPLVVPDKVYSLDR